MSARYGGAAKLAKGLVIGQRFFIETPNDCSLYEFLKPIQISRYNVTQGWLLSPSHTPGKTRFCRHVVTAILFLAGRSLAARTTSDIDLRSRRGTQLGTDETQRWYTRPRSRQLLVYSAGSFSLGPGEVIISYSFTTQEAYSRFKVLMSLKNADGFRVKVALTGPYADSTGATEANDFMWSRDPSLSSTCGMQAVASFTNDNVYVFTTACIRRERVLRKNLRTTLVKQVAWKMSSCPNLDSILESILDSRWWVEDNSRG
jgi:hypothetical protein